MATNKDPIFLNTVTGSGLTFLPADASAQKTLITAPADGSALTDISCTSTDTNDVVMVITLNDVSSDFLIGEVNVPAGSGTDGSSPAVNLLSAAALPFLQADGSILIPATWLVKINAKTTITAAKQIDVVGFGGNFGA